MIFEFLASLFTPAANLIEKIVTKDNDKIALKNQLAQIEAQVATKLMELQVKALEMQSAVAVSEQQNGNWLSKSWRPIVSIIFAANILLMGYGLIPYSEMIIQISGMFLGIYGIGRSFEKRGK